MSAGFLPWIVGLETKPATLGTGLGGRLDTSLLTHSVERLGMQIR